MTHCHPVEETRIWSSLVLQRQPIFTTQINDQCPLLNTYSSSLSPSDSLQRCSTMLGGGMPVTTSSSYLLQSSSSPGWSSSLSGTRSHRPPTAPPGCYFVYHVFNLHSVYCRILYCTWVYPVTIYEPFFGYYFFNGLLLTLQCLHIFWAVLIIRIAVRFLTNNVSKQRHLTDVEICPDP